MFTTCDDLNCIKYGWVLKVAPFIGNTLPGVDDNKLEVLLGDQEQQLKVDIALSTINDKRVTVDTDNFRELNLQGEVLDCREQELEEEQATWRAKLNETRGCLTKAQVHSHVHPYLNHTVLIPDHYCSETMCTGGVTLATAVVDTCTCGLHWYTIPHLHDKEFPGNRPTHCPLPYPHHCQLCQQLQPKHTVWGCPKVRDCCYCKAHDHSSNDCPNPHAECFYKSECVVPLTHHKNITHNARQCPACQDLAGSWYA